MNTTIKCFMAFAVGVGVGTAVAWKILEDKFEKFAQEEIDSVKETLLARKANCEPESEESNDISEEPSSERPNLDGYAKTVRKEDHIDYSGIRSSDVAKKMADVEKPRVIAPDEFGDSYDYSQITLTHYSDGVLTDEDDEIIDDVEGAVGTDYADHFGEYEEDAVHVVNDIRKCYYEILRDYRNYSDVVGGHPHQMED